MRLAVAAVALVATFQCCSAADGNSFRFTNFYGDAAAKKAAQEMVAVPIGLIWKDLYEALVHQKGSKALRKLGFLTAGLLKKNDALELTHFLMDKLKKEVFNNRVNEKAWNALTMELYYALKEWWVSTPENPKDAADIGVWHALVNLYKQVLAPSLRGSNRVGSMNEILLDPELNQIRKWVSEWKGSPGKTKPQEKPAKPAEAGEVNAKEQATSGSD